MQRAHTAGPTKIPRKYTGRPAIPQMYVPGRSNTKKGKTCEFRRRIGSICRVAIKTKNENILKRKIEQK